MINFVTNVNGRPVRVIVFRSSRGWHWKEASLTGHYRAFRTMGYAAHVAGAFRVYYTNRNPFRGEMLRRYGRAE